MSGGSRYALDGSGLVDFDTVYDKMVTSLPKKRRDLEHEIACETWLSD